MKIEQQYFRALELLWEAVHICHSTYFYDNSINKSDDEDWEPLVARVSTMEGQTVFDLVGDRLPKWVKHYCLDKI